MNKNINISQLFFVFLLSCISWSCSEYTPSPYPIISFTQKTAMPDQGRASAVAFVINGKAYVTTGRTLKGKQLNDCWQYDPNLDTWSKKADFPDTPRVKAIAAVVNGKAYVGLGCNDSLTNGINNSKATLRGLRSYDPISDSWSAPLAIFPGKAPNACVAFVAGTDIYVGSGFGFSFSNEWWKYSTLENKWFQLKNLPFLNRSGAIVCTDSLHIYFGTGYMDDNLSDWWEYFPNTDTWKQKSSFNFTEGRTNGLGISIKGRYFVTTGRHTGGDLTTGKLYSDIIEYDPAKDTWYQRGFLPTKGRENAICFTINGIGYIGLGENSIFDSPNAVLNDLWSFIP